MVFFIEPMKSIVNNSPNLPASSSASSPISRELLDRYLANECTSLEMMDVERWISADIRRRALVDELVHASQATSFDWASQKALDSAKRRFNTQFGQDEATRVPSNHGWLRRSIAVGAVLLACIGFFTYPIATKQSADLPGTTYVTNNGERVHHRLPDGTMVTMNAASRLEVPAQYGITHRTLHLSGEAYFEATSSSTLPLVVHAGDATIRVLGTEFNVRAYDQNDIRVAVRSGRVAFENVVLGANDFARMTPERVVQVAKANNSDNAFGFTRGWLTLNNVTLRQSIPDLNRWYDADVRIIDPRMGDQLLYATLPAGSIEDLAEALRTIFDVNVAVQGRVVTLGYR